MKVKTETGFECEIDPEALNDYEVIELIVGTEQGSMQSRLASTVGLMNKILSPDGVAKLKDHVRRPNGTVPLDEMKAEITRIFQSMGESEKK